MALKTVKRSGEYKFIFSGDDALALPAGKKERQKAIEIAWETGVFPLKPGKTMADAVVFTCKPLGSDLVATWRAWKDEHGNTLADTELGWMTLGRIALVAVAGMDDAEVVIEVHKKFGPVASAALFDGLGPELSRAVQFELGACVFHRETTTLGK